MQDIRDRLGSKGAVVPCGGGIEYLHCELLLCSALLCKESVKGQI
jgi:hypothetical protein